jgi:hypothetical protein
MVRKGDKQSIDGRCQTGNVTSLGGGTFIDNTASSFPEGNAGKGKMEQRKTRL